MFFKNLLSKYGLMFGAVYVIAFFLLITLSGQFDLPTFPGDIKFGNFFYLPFTSSAAIAIFTTIMLEMYNVMKHM